MKRVFIIHGWGGNPDEAWFPWLGKELAARGFVAHVPQMPNTDTPRIEEWVGELADLVGSPDAETYFVGHSIGVQTILRYIESINVTVGGVLSVAGWYTLIPGSIGGPEDEKVAEPWLMTPINDEKVRKQAGKTAAIFSDDDKYVGLENVKMFEERLGAKTTVLHGKGHLGSSDNVPEVPEVLAAAVSLF